jgi:hypothetical protein
LSDNAGYRDDTAATERAHQTVLQSLPGIFGFGVVISVCSGRGWSGLLLVGWLLCRLGRFGLTFLSECCGEE